MRVLPHEGKGQFVCLCLADEFGSRGKELFNHRSGFRGGRRFGQNLRISASGRHSGDVINVLDRQPFAFKRSPVAWATGFSGFAMIALRGS